MQEHLIVIGVLRREDRRILQVIHVHRTRETDGRLHHELLDHLHDAVVLDHTPAPDTAALASLALAVGLDRRLFPRSDRSAVRHRTGEAAARCSDGALRQASAVTAAVNAADAARGITPFLGRIPSGAPILRHSPSGRSGDATSVSRSSTDVDESALLAVVDRNEHACSHSIHVLDDDAQRAGPGFRS